MPARVKKEALEQAVRLTAAAALACRHAPSDGARHGFFLALAGTLARAQWHITEAQRFHRAIYRVLWHEEADLAAAEKEVSSTFERYASGDVNITGLKTLREMLDPRVFSKLKEWLRLKEETIAKPTERKVVALPVLSSEALWTKEITMPEQLIRELVITPGLTLLVGAPKAGKTILAVQMGFSLAAGVSFLDNFTLRQTGFYILEWDDPMGEASLKLYQAKSRVSTTYRPVFEYTVEKDSSLDITDPGFIQWLKKTILEYRAGYVVLDSYTALRGIRSGGIDVVKMEARDLRMLADLATETKTAIILIHHGSKSAAQLEWSSRAAGTFAMHAGPNTQIFMERMAELPEGDPARLIHLQSRQLRDKTMIVRYREETFDYDLVLEGPACNEYPKLRQLYQAYPERRFTAKEIGQEFGWARATTYRLLSKLIGSGILDKRSGAFSWNFNKFNGKNL
jgi:hypothetical protein